MHTGDVNPPHRRSRLRRLRAGIIELLGLLRSRQSVRQPSHGTHSYSAPASERVSSFLTAHQHIIGHFSAITWY